MKSQAKQPGLGPLPEFLEISVQRGLVDSYTAHRIELYRRSRGLGEAESRPPLLNDPPDPTLTFDNFVISGGNSLAVELAETVVSASTPPLPFNPLYIHGEIGIGKTHLLSAIFNAAEDKEALLVNTADLITELERAEERHSRAELREWLSSVEILMVDDIQFCEGREDLQHDLFSVLNHITKAHRWLVIGSDVPPSRLAGVESRLVSRLGGGVVAGIQMGNALERMDLIQHFLGDGSMPDDVVHYLAENVTDNVRRLKAVVAQLLTLHKTTHMPVTLEMAHAVVPLPEAAGRSVKASESLTHHEETPDERASSRADSRVNRFKEMLAGAESEEEQALALQIAFGERIRQLRNEQGDPEDIRRLERAVEQLREGKMEEAIRCIST